MEPKEIKNIIECILFVSDKPVSIGTFQGLIEDVDRRSLLESLDELKADYDSQGRAFQLVEIAEGYQLATRVHYAPWIRKMFKTRTTNKLSRAALETLAIIAYRQPITKAEIEDIRGVSADGVVNALTDRKFIRMVGRKEVIGRPILYGTTKEFLHYFGLKDLTDMPELKDLQDILKQEEIGKDWQLNKQGDLVAKLKGDEDADALTGQEQESADQEQESADQEQESADQEQESADQEQQINAEQVNEQASSADEEIKESQPEAAIAETINQDGEEQRP